MPLENPIQLRVKNRCSICVATQSVLWIRKGIRGLTICKKCFGKVATSQGMKRFSRENPRPQEMIAKWRASYQQTYLKRGPRRTLTLIRWLYEGFGNNAGISRKTTTYHRATVGTDSKMFVYCCKCADPLIHLVSNVKRTNGAIFCDKCKVVWNKGKTGIYSEATLKVMKTNLSKALKKKYANGEMKAYWKGKKILAITGPNHPNYGKKLPQYHLDILAKVRSEMRVPNYDTKPEKLVHEELGKHGIEFRKQKAFKINKGYHQVDIWIEPNICIEIYGGYWHADPRVLAKKTKYLETGIVRHGMTAEQIWERDAMIRDRLIVQGQRVFVVWELDILNGVSDALSKVLQEISPLILSQ